MRRINAERQNALGLRLGHTCHSCGGDFPIFGVKTSEELTERQMEPRVILWYRITAIATGRHSFVADGVTIS